MRLQTKGDALKKFERVANEAGRGVGKRILRRAQRAERERIEKKVRQVQNDKDVFGRKKRLKTELKRELMMLNPLYSKVKQLELMASCKKD